MDVVTLKRRQGDRLVASELRASRFFPAKAYDEATGAFLCDDGTVGFCFACTPLPGADEQTEQRLELMLNQGWPDGAMMQFFLWRSPDIAGPLAAMRALRQGAADDGAPEAAAAAAVFAERLRFLSEHAARPLVARTRAGAAWDAGRVVDVKLAVTLKLPCAAALPSDADLQGASEWAGKLMSGLASAGLRPRRLTAEGWLRLMGTVLNWGPRAGWRRPGALWERADTLDSQVLDWDTRVALAESDLIALGEAQCVKVLSAKTLARKMFFGEAMCYAGDLSGQNQGVKANYAVAANVWWPPLDKERGRLARMRQWATQQALGPLVKFEPVLGDCKRSHDVLYESMTQSAARPVRMSFSVLVFAEDRERASRLSVQLQSAWATQRFRLMEDRWVMLPMLVNCLPLGADAEAVAELWRYHTLTTHELPVLLPVMAEWKGTGTPHMALLSRNGQLMSLSLHDGSTNRNAVVAAESGSGKSFFLNELIVSYLSAGAQVWVIDAGKSYHKLCLALGGSFLAFDGESAVHLNPFAHVDDWEDEEDALVAVAAQMASARGDLSEFQTAEIKRIMKSLHDAGRLTVDALREACLASGDRRTGDVGAQLYAFSSAGAYGRYFRGGQAQPLDGRFTVLELDELQGRRHLRQVVLLELIEAIERTMIRGDRSRKKLLIIDEAWDLLKDGAAAAFMEQAYRKFRKYNGSAIIATQSVADLYDNPAGRAIAENSASLFLLGQKAEAIEAAREKKQLVLSPAGFHTLKGVHTEAGAYSEIFLRTEAGQGVGRLVVSDFQKLLYSTSAEDVHAIEAKRKAGMSIAEAIGAILRERQGGPA